MIQPEQKIYLASKSPRRRELLRQIGVEFEILMLREAPGRPGAVSEIPYPDEDPEVYVRRVAREKGEAGWQTVLSRRLPIRPVLSYLMNDDMNSPYVRRPEVGADYGVEPIVEVGSPGAATEEVGTDVVEVVVVGISGFSFSVSGSAPYTQTGVFFGTRPEAQIMSMAGTLTRTHPCEAG